MKVIDDFLPSYFFDQLQNTLLNDEFPWYYNANVVGTECDTLSNFQFTHTFYDIRPRWNGEASDYFSLLGYCIQKMECKNLYRIKANLNPRTVFHRKGGWHIDFIDDPPITTAILYLNSNNGWTRFKKDGRVKSVANRLVIFDSNQEHSGVTCTDEKCRVVINFNYDL